MSAQIDIFICRYCENCDTSTETTGVCNRDQLETKLQNDACDFWAIKDGLGDLEKL